eukprot:SAG31_NODE_4520_length_3170_cov_2.797134_4_plen_167_part_00
MSNQSCVMGIVDGLFAHCLVAAGANAVEILQSSSALVQQPGQMPLTGKVLSVGRKVGGHSTNSCRQDGSLHLRTASVVYETFVSLDCRLKQTETRSHVGSFKTLPPDSTENRQASKQICRARVGAQTPAFEPWSGLAGALRLSRIQNRGTRTIRNHGGVGVPNLSC